MGNEPEIRRGELHRGAERRQGVKFRLGTGEQQEASPAREGETPLEPGRPAAPQVVLAGPAPEGEGGGGVDVRLPGVDQEDTFRAVFFKAYGPQSRLGGLRADIPRLGQHVP